MSDRCSIELDRCSIDIRWTRKIVQGDAPRIPRPRRRGGVHQEGDVLPRLGPDEGCTSQLDAVRGSAQKQNKDLHGRSVEEGG